ncbi:MAG: N-acetylglutaminylglutamine synthetase [Hyphomicrobiaceae bacterium]|nr:N-acetylglutaminylglutamine synthetase [Hyphomicrobiaceae bacterium]
MAEPRKRRRTPQHRLARMHQASSGSPPDAGHLGVRNATFNCGWGRLIFAQTFESPAGIAETLRAEGPDRRDIAFYVRDPHVLLAAAPQELFLDPSHTYRLELATYRASHRRQKSFFVRRLTTEQDAEAVNIIYAGHGMVTVPPEFFWGRRDDRALTVLVAEDAESGTILGTAMGVDHAQAFDDPEHGSSLWCLAVSPQAPHPGIGDALVRRLAEQFKARGADYMDLSVMHNNVHAIALYEKLGFRRVQAFSVKRKNTINETLYTGASEEEAALNPYSRIIVDEARRRGIAVSMIDAEGGFFRLTYGGRSVACRESLSEFTSAVAMSICDDKRVTRRLVEAAGVRVPAQLSSDDPDELHRFLEQHGGVVVKPARGEQGRGIAVGLTDMADVEDAIPRAREVCPDVLLEEYFEGFDLRLIVIDFKVVAAAVRRPARIIGDGTSTVLKLIEAQSRRRAAATGGESSIPLDGETERCVAAAGYAFDDIPDSGREVVVRKTANLHTGGTIHDVTAETHPALIEAAIAAARAIDIPVTGIDLMVKGPSQPDYVFIEANERPGLANHEPQPTAERFIDLLFPLSVPEPVRAQQRKRTT